MKHAESTSPHARHFSKTHPDAVVGQIQSAKKERFDALAAGGDETIGLLGVYECYFFPKK